MGKDQDTYNNIDVDKSKTVREVKRKNETSKISAKNFKRFFFAFFYIFNIWAFLHYPAYYNSP